MCDCDTDISCEHMGLSEHPHPNPSHEHVEIGFTGLEFSNWESPFSKWHLHNWNL